MPLIGYLGSLISTYEMDQEQLRQSIQAYENLLSTGYSLGSTHRLTEDEKSAIGQQINRWRTALEASMNGGV